MLFSNEEYGMQVSMKFINENKKLREVERFLKSLVKMADDSKNYHEFYPKLYKMDK
jgi:hypothetical protein